MNVAAGGTLLQHLPESHGHHEHRRNPGSFDGADHDVRLDDGSLAARAAGEVVHGTKSHHHQAVDRVGEGFEVTGWSSIDELPEAFEAPDRRFALGVQWHPEADEQQPPHRRARGRGRRRAQRLALMSRGGGAAAAARRTVLVALAANASIAVAKLVAGLVSGSSAMLAEAAHSVADTMNQVFLLFSLALGEREPDAEHPFGYGKERFFWSFLAAVGIFVAGAGFSLYEGLHRIFGPPAEHGSLRHRLRRPRLLPPGRGRVARARLAPDARARRPSAASPHASYVRASRDPTTKTVLFEDSAARHRRRRWPSRASRCTRPPATRSTTAWPRSRSACCWPWSRSPSVATPRTLLIGEAATPEERQAITEIIEAHPAVDRVLELLTMALAPDRLLVAARVDLADGLSADEIERASSEIDRELRERIPTVWQVFLDATPPRSEVAQAAGDRPRATGA